MRQAFLIDGTAFCYRAFYAIRHLSTSDGRPTNAVYGFAMMLQSLLDKERPAYLGVAFDVGKPTFRHRKFEDYKAQRKPMPDPLIGQLPLVKALLAAYRVPAFEREGYEAEDVLASIAMRITSPDLEVLLVTGDKDALQLVNSHVKVYNPHKENAVLDAEAVRSRYGVDPSRMVDLMALMGDEIDNIPGVPGIGEKTARGLLERFGSLEELYEHLPQVENAARRNTLASCRKQVELARELARIDTKVPVDVSLQDLAVREPDWRALRSLFRELEFKRLLEALDREAPKTQDHATLTRSVVTGGDLETLLGTLSGGARSQEVAVACWPVGTSAVILALACEERQAHAPNSVVRGQAWVVPLEASTLETAEGRRLAEWMAGPAPKLSHDAKAVKRILRQVGMALNGVTGDTMIAAYLVNPARVNQTLSDLSAEYLDQPLGPIPKIEALLPVSLEPFGPAACAILRLHTRLVEELNARDLLALYTELELPLLHVLARMEDDGIAIDVAQLSSLRTSMESTLTQRSQEIFRLAGCSFNLNSPKQLAKVLFERLGLPVLRRTKTGPSTDSDVLRQLAQRHPLPETLMRYRELSKLMSTYVEALPKLVDPATGRIHTSLNQTATATGRLSSSEPNLQNIPIKTELGRSIRAAFIPGIPDGMLVAADYSQVELRILAHLSGDEQLSEAFRCRRDIHRFTASLIYGCPETEVQPAQRNAMKAINYGILYGMTSHGLSKELGLSFDEAQAFIDAYFGRYPRVREYLDRQIAQARREGFVQTLLGRRRYIPEVNSPDAVVRQFGERMAVNAPIQGTAADLIKRAMVQLAAELTREGFRSRMVLQVHDELIFEAPRRELGRLVPLVRRIMEGAIALDVPLTVTMKSGPNWRDLVELKG